MREKIYTLEIYRTSESRWRVRGYDDVPIFFPSHKKAMRWFEETIERIIKEEYGHGWRPSQIYEEWGADPEWVRYSVSLATATS